MGIKGPGLHFKIPFIDRISGRVNMKIQQLDVMVETKTFDDVFVKTMMYSYVKMISPLLSKES